MVAVLMVSNLTDLLKPKWLENRWQSAKTNNSFYDLDKDSTEVLFFGTSVMAAAVDPYQLYEDYGISSYNLGVMSQPMAGTYFWMKEAAKTQDYKVAVVDIKAVGRVSDKSEAKSRKSYDYMKFGLNKLQYAIEYKNSNKDLDGTDSEVDLWEYLFPLSLYHSRWSELDYDDYDFFLGNDESTTRGFATLSGVFKNNSHYNAKKAEKGKYDGFELSGNETGEYNATNRAYLERIIKFANENNIKLVFIRTPDTQWNLSQHNYTQAIADENNIEFIDFNVKSMRKKLNIDFAMDAADSVHLNINGTKKVTSYIGKYLSKNCNLTDYKEKGGSIKESIESGIENYNETMKNAKIAMETNLDKYLKAINSDDYAVIAVAGSNTKKISFNSEQKKLFDNIGIDSTMFDVDNYYGANIVSVADGANTVNTLGIQNSDYSTVTTEGGTLSCNTDYYITAQNKTCSIRLNDGELTSIHSEYFNIVVYNKKLKTVADTVYLYNDGEQIVLGREET
jgi:hypothetical protein